MSTTNFQKSLLILGIILIAFNLRAPITAVGSIVEMIQQEYQLSASAAGFITTLPLISFALISPFVARLSAKSGAGKTMGLGLLAILLGELIRSYTTVEGLYAGTFLLGVGIAIGNVLIPSFIKNSFPSKVGIMTSVYISSMCIFAAVGAGASLPLAKGLNLGWSNSLASWGILAFITFLIWLPQFKHTVKNKTSLSVQEDKQIRSIWKSATAWWVTLFMGTQSLLFYSLVAWFPTILLSKGCSESFAGNMALLFQLAAIPVTLVIPMLCDKVKNQKGLSTIVALIYLAGMTLLLLSSSSSVLLFSTVLLSIGMGGSISLSIAFISLRSINAQRTSELSGMSQSAGYLLAACGPTLTGFLFDQYQNWNLPIIIFCSLIVSLLICGLFAGANVYTDAPAEKLESTDKSEKQLCA